MSNAELNERDLEGVSGGSRDNRTMLLYDARKLCRQCQHTNSCAHGPEGLCDYMMEHGVDLINPLRCPYFNEAE